MGRYSFRILNLLICCVLGCSLAVIPTAAQTAARKKPATKAATSKSKSTAKTSAKSSKSSKSKRAAAKSKKKTKRISPQKAQRIRRAFKASEQLRPMAEQLLDNRTPAAYAGVEAYARKHAGTDAGALAWLTLGYAHLLDKDFAKSVASLDKAKARAGELSDYVRYFEAQAYAGLAQPENVLTVLKAFPQNTDDSIFAREAQVLTANALVGQDRADEATKLLEDNRLPTRSDIEFALGKAYLAAGNRDRSSQILRHLYYTFPTSYDATQAGIILKSEGEPIEGTFEDRRTRADLLAKAGRWSDAASEYRALLADAPADQRGNVQVLLAVALRRTGDDAQGRQLLESATASGEYNARRLYFLGEFARNKDDAAALKANLDRMRQEAATSTWFQQALISAANFYLLRKDYDPAIDLYREAALRFPQGGNTSSYAHWKAAWLTYRQNRIPDAKNAFENQIDKFPAGAEAAGALYWRAKIAEREGDVELARAWYGKCVERFRYYYYGVLAARRLAALPKRDPSLTPLVDPRLEKIAPPTAPSDDAFDTTPPTDDLRVEKSKLLINAGLTDFAVKELQASDGGQGANWATLQIARLYSTAGLPHRALQFLKRSVPNYYSFELSNLPRDYWEFLFPTPFWSELRRDAQANGLDPYLVASLIRQESEFNPRAVSHANAYGLMQLLPTVGRGMARELRIGRVSETSLLDPNVNLKLGTRYFKQMVDQFGGQVEYALAAYNAGTNRVTDWQASGTYADIDEFVESIPFTETREYVQAIVRNAHVYSKLYPQNRVASK